MAICGGPAFPLPPPPPPPPTVHSGGRRAVDRGGRARMAARLVVCPGRRAALSPRGPGPERVLESPSRRARRRECDARRVVGAGEAGRGGRGGEGERRAARPAPPTAPPDDLRASQRSRADRALIAGRAVHLWR